MKRSLIALLFFLMVFVCSPVSVKAASRDDVLVRMNAARVQAGLSELVFDDSLQSAAEIRAVECATRFSHTRPGGKAWYTVGDTAGENLAWAQNPNQTKAENVVLAWLLSSTHKENVMRATFSAVGIAYYYADDGNTYIACEFR